MYQKVRGMADLSFNEATSFENVISIAQEHANLYNFWPIYTPCVEKSEVFERNLGEESDAVSKELYRFDDRSGEKIALRPEFTAGIARAFIEKHELYSYAAKLPLKLFAHGPLFRYDRPQKGRYRQFNQLNFECFGAVSDAYCIIFAQNLLSKLGIKTKLLINSLGSKICIEKYEKALTIYFADKNLSKLSIERLASNPLRILDSKEEQDIEIVKNAPSIEEFYSPEEKNSFAATLQNLKSSGMQYEVAKTLVRGLDYYTGIVFEFFCDVQNLTILAGGRYDELIQNMGGKPMPAIGFAAGIERIMLSMCHIIMPRIFIFLKDGVYFNDSLCGSYCREILTLGSSIGKSLGKLEGVYGAFAIIYGQKEEESGKFRMKYIKTREESDDIDDASGVLKFIHKCIPSTSITTNAIT